jgi:hypothetical protein
VNEPTVIGFTPDGSGAYLQWCDRDRNVSGVALWPWRNGGEIASLAQAAGFTRDTGGQASNWPRIFSFRDHNGAAGAARFLSIPNFMEAYPTHKFVVMLHDGSTATRSIDVQPMPNAHQKPVVSADGTTLFLEGYDRANVLGVDLDSGETIGTVMLPVLGGGTGGLARSKGGRYLVIGDGRGLLVRDTEAKMWCVRLTLPASLYGPRPSVSPDGRWIAAVCQGSNKSFFRRVVVWDLGDHRLVETTNSGVSGKRDGASGR